MLAFSLMAFFMFIHFILFPIVVLFISFLFFFLFSFLKPSWFALHIPQYLHMTRCCHPNITSHFTDQCHYWPSSTSHNWTTAFSSTGCRGLPGLYPLHQTDMADTCVRLSWGQPYLLCLLHQGGGCEVSAYVSGAGWVHLVLPRPVVPALTLCCAESVPAFSPENVITEICCLLL